MSCKTNSDGLQGYNSLCMCLFSPVVAMEEVTRLVSTGDCVKIWDAVSMAPLEQFNPHSTSHPVAQACWSSNSILLSLNHHRLDMKDGNLRSLSCPTGGDSSI